MDSPKQVVKIYPKPRPFAELKDLYPSIGYYNNTHSTIRNLNKWLGLDPEMVYPKIYDDKFTEIMQWIPQRYRILNHSQISSKVAQIQSALQRCGFNNSKFKLKRRQVNEMPIEVIPKQFPTQTWQQLKDQLDQVIATCNLPNVRAIAICYRHGYLLRSGEIFLTSTVPDPNLNYLDMKGLVWHIKAALTKNRTDRQFTVTKEFCDQLEPLVRNNRIITKKNGQPYTSHCYSLAMIKANTFMPQVSVMRSIYEGWNWARVDVSDTEKTRISVSVLGHSACTANTSYTPNECLASDDE